MNENSIEKWSEFEKIGYMLKYAHVENKCDIIKLLEEEEVLKHMTEIKNEFLVENTMSLAQLKAFCDKCDEDKREEWIKDWWSKKGFQQGLEKGFEVGIEQEKRKIAMNMYKAHVSLEQIAAIVEMSLESLKELLEK